MTAPPLEERDVQVAAQVACIADAGGAAGVLRLDSFGGRGVDTSSWCLLFVLMLSGAQVPQLVARRSALRFATHAHPGEQTPLPLPAKAILTRPLTRYEDSQLLYPRTPQPVCSRRGR